MTRRSAIVRPPAVAGSFYPADPVELAGLVDRLLAEASAAGSSRAASRPAQRSGSGPPHAIIVPHAGYAYSGAVAATAFALVARARHGSRSRAWRVALLGPAHFAPLFGAAVPTVDAWATPLGEISIDDDLRRLALDAGARPDDQPHAGEHALENQLPFLQRIAGPDLRILPVAVGPEGRSSRAAEILPRLAAVADLVVVSTDLSHYHDDVTARRLDGRTVEAILARDPDSIRDDAACGLDGLRRALEWASLAGLPVRLLDRRTSADAGGGRSQVVGYAAFAIG